VAIVNASDFVNAVGEDEASIIDRDPGVLVAHVVAIQVNHHVQVISPGKWFSDAMRDAKVVLSKSFSPDRRAPQLPPASASAPRIR
jgi:hypothetical protein